MPVQVSLEHFHTPRGYSNTILIPILHQHVLDEFLKFVVIVEMQPRNPYYK